MTLKIQNNIDNINLKKTSAAQIAAEKFFKKSSKKKTISKAAATIRK